MTITLLPYDPTWPELAGAEIARWRAEAGAQLADIHHIGSTSVRGLVAKPVIDLLPIARSPDDLEDLRPIAEALGYLWMGEYGLPRRRYCKKDDPDTGARLFQAHCYADGDPEALRHLGFRDALRSDPSLARTYGAVKQACAARHPDDIAAYGRCKSGFIDDAERTALERPT